MYVLVISPPSLLFLATLACGIASLVYLYQGRADKLEITKNKQTIEINNEQINKNHHSLQNLLMDTIPNLESQIKKDELIRDNSDLLLKKTQEQSKQALQKAATIEPHVYSGTSFLDKIHNDERKEKLK